MSEKETDIFKNVFQEAFHSHTEMVEEENWDLISARLDKKRFFKFNPKKFNVYYASALVMTGASILAFILFTSENNTSTLKSEEQNNKGQELNLPSDTNANWGNSAATSNLPKKSSDSKKNQGRIKDSEIKNISQDSVTTSPVIVPIEEPKKVFKETPKEKKKEKEYFIYEQDTIIEKDTINLKRRKKRK